jgi:hypothetical protein
MTVGQNFAINWTRPELVYVRIHTVICFESHVPEAATFSDDTAVLATDSDPGIAAQKLQTNPDAIQKWLKTWRIKANESKLVHITFITRRETCLPAHINVHLPQQDVVKYLGLHLDRRLTWRKHLFTERKQVGMTLIKMLLWLLRRKFELSTSNNILIYKAIFKPICTYGIQLWVGLQIQTQKS